VFEIGGSLAAARQAQGLGLPEVEALTCIRAKYLAALEAERFAALPGRAYARAFLRTYASALGLEADRFVDEYDARFPEPEEEPLLTHGFPRRTFPTRLVVIAAAVLGVVAFVAWSGTTTSHTPTTSVARSPVVERASVLPPPVVQSPRPVSAPHPPPPPRPLVIRAAGGPCWLLVRRASATGTVLYEATLQQGQVVRFRAPRVWVRFGAPWNVTVTRGTRPVHGLSGTGPVDLVA